MTIKYLAREQFAKGTDLGEPEKIALVKSGGLDGREIVGKDALAAFLKAEALEAETIERAVDETKDDEVSFPFVLSTNAEDRQRDVIKQSGWKLDSYRKNPVVLWAHDYSTLPVARASAIYVAGDKLKAVDRFSKDHELARTCAALYAKGFLNAVSVGFRPLKWAWNEERGGFAADFEECELLEHSAVPVPAHQDALIEARAAGHDVAPVIEWAEKALEARGGLYLPKALIEGAIAKTSTRLVVDFGKGRDAKSLAVAEVPAPERVEVEKPVDLAKALEIVKAAGLAVCTPDLVEALRAPAVAPAKPEPTPAETPVKNAAAPAEPAFDLAAAFRDEMRGALKGAFSDPLRRFATSVTGRLD